MDSEKVKVALLKIKECFEAIEDQVDDAICEVNDLLVLLGAYPREDNFE